MIFTYDGCPFCHELNGDISRSFYYKHIYPLTNVVDRVIFETEHFVLIPAIGAFVEGYMLAVTKKHYFSLMASPEYVIKDFLELELKVSKYFTTFFKSGYVYFEHGATSSDNGGTSVVHSHIHFIPYAEHLDLPKVDYTEKTISESLFEIYNTYSRDMTYLLYRFPNGIISYYTGGHFPSQVLRKITAQKLGVSDKWDWKNNFCEGNMMKTLQGAKRYIK